MAETLVPTLLGPVPPSGAAGRRDRQPADELQAWPAD
jgi:hypothetical protein